MGPSQGPPKWLAATESQSEFLSLKTQGLAAVYYYGVLVVTGYGTPDNRSTRILLDLRLGRVRALVPVPTAVATAVATTAVVATSS
eukprot:COSAG05_NODE_6980_length_871_cov_1.252591_1_plen_86_part_00